MAGGKIKRPRQISLMEGDFARDVVLSVGMALELDAECLGGVSCLASLAVEVGSEAEKLDVEPRGYIKSSISLPVHVHPYSWLPPSSFPLRIMSRRVLSIGTEPLSLCEFIYATYTTKQHKAENQLAKSSPLISADLILPVKVTTMNIL